MMIAVANRIPIALWTHPSRSMPPTFFVSLDDGASWWWFMNEWKSSTFLLWWEWKIRQAKDGVHFGLRVVALVWVLGGWWSVLGTNIHVVLATLVSIMDTRAQKSSKWKVSLWSLSWSSSEGHWSTSIIGYGFVLDTNWTCCKKMRMMSSILLVAVVGEVKKWWCLLAFAFLVLLLEVPLGMGFHLNGVSTKWWCKKERTKGKMCWMIQWVSEWVSEPSRRMLYYVPSFDGSADCFPIVAFSIAALQIDRAHKDLLFFFRPWTTVALGLWWFDNHCCGLGGAWRSLLLDVLVADDASTSMILVVFGRTDLQFSKRNSSLHDRRYVPRRLLLLLPVEKQKNLKLCV